eukprot:CAMPEP_0177714616 /NCGR_PEP_ID=MMETSP0484_2-20121128/13549_1 /TAXON_ID=354590 /ORGANISM="Rhodomonas lens, Strain RHODO" /LENGTH=304 /DNA_ID=CAMNT_0019226547 /DNA_START=107 /DNA_END=1017 /DNA_ORIENTATION=-
MTEGGRIFRSTRRRVPSSRMSACQPRPRASPQRLPGQGGWLLAAAACAALCCPSSAFIAPSRSPLSATSSRLEAGTSRGAGAWLVRPAGARPVRPVSSAALSLRCNGEPRLPVGRITTLDRSKISTDSDSVFYAAPRLVTHADEAWITQLQALYRQRIKTGARVLDLMSSHVSHIPVEVSCSRVDVHGMNEEELCNNPAMQATGGSVFVHDLNREPSLPFAGECEYDAVLCALGVQYLEQAEMVFAEAGRVLAPDGVVIVSFSSNFFYEKALTGWIERGMQGRSRLVKDYLRAAGGFAEIEELG